VAGRNIDWCSGAEKERHPPRCQFVGNREGGFLAELHVKAGAIGQRVKKRQRIPGVGDRTDDQGSGLLKDGDNAHRYQIIVFDDKNPSTTHPFARHESLQPSEKSSI
jgi:hypothetical protein